MAVGNLLKATSGKWTLWSFIHGSKGRRGTNGGHWDRVRSSLALEIQNCNWYNYSCESVGNIW